MKLPEAAISDKLTKAISNLIVEYPEHFFNAEDPRAMAGTYLAKHHPEVFDPSNPVDQLALLLASME